MRTRKRFLSAQIRVIRVIRVPIVITFGSPYNLYSYNITVPYQAKGFEKVEIFLDRNTTHKTKMQQLFATLTTHLTITTTFHLMAPYSPKLNLVEYAIHLIRQKVPHHADCKTSLVQFEKLIKTLCDNQAVVTKQQIINILVHIESLIPNL